MTWIIFFLGLFVTAIACIAVFFVDLQEAADPSQSRIEDLTEFEKRMVGRSDDE
jgi:hypothetical protein